MRSAIFPIHFLRLLILRLLMSASLLLGLSQAYADEGAEPQRSDYVYDARMAFIKAGKLNLALDRDGDAYEVAGEFKTSRALSPYYTWNGVFAAVGTWRGLGPVTTAYMSRSSSKDDKMKIVLTYPDATRVLKKGREDFETTQRPGGIDLISALFFNPTCYEGTLVHDGEDSYQLSLIKQRKHALKGGRDYFNGEVVSCDYRVVDHKGRKRRVVVSLADINGQQIAVQVRAKIPLLPDAIFKLRVLDSAPNIAAAH